MSDSCVYAARCLLTNGQPTGLLKVGFSMRPQERIHCLEGVLPFDFELVLCFRGGFFSEQATHLLLRQWRSKGEYFWDGPEIRSALAKMKRQGSPHPMIRDTETGKLWKDTVDLQRTIRRLGVDTAAIADHLHITPSHLATRLNNKKITSRTIAAGVSLAAADKGIRTAWPDDFFRNAA